MRNVHFMNAIYEYEQTLGLSENMLRGDLLPPEERLMLIENDNAFLFGLISDQSVRAETAWSLPYKLSKRLGHFSVNKMVKESSIAEFQQIIKEKPSLHRYPANIGKYLWLAAEKLVSEYNSSAKNIWTQVPAREIVTRLENFAGISHKKASLACLLLIRDLGLEVSDKENVDIIYDIHIRRIFLRTGFSRKDSLHCISEAARKLNPDFPGYLTSSFWAIGREICRPSNPQCERCPISEFCEKNLDLGGDIHA